MQNTVSEKLCLLVFFILISVSLFAQQAPQITGITPISGPIGTLVTITGSNLSSPTAFTIEGTQVIVISNDGSKLVGMVMPGAISGAVAITTSGGTITQGIFSVTTPVLPTVQQGGKYVPPDMAGNSDFGFILAVSADVNTPLIGGPIKI